MKRIFLISVLGFFLFAPAQRAAATDALSVDVGGVSINAPAPAAFREVTGVSAVMADLAGKFVPADNLLLGMYLPQPEYETILAGRIPHIERYAFLQTPRALIQDLIDPPRAQQILAAVRQEQEDPALPSQEGVQGTLDRSSRDFNRDYGFEMRSSLEDTQPLGVFFEAENALGFSQIVRYSFEVDGQITTQNVVNAAIVMIVDGKVLLACFYSPHTGEEDVLWAQDSARSWVAAIAGANDLAAIAARQQQLALVEVVPAPPPASDGFPYPALSLIQYLAVAGVVLALLALALLRRQGRL